MAMISLCRPETLVSSTKLLTNPKNSRLLLRNFYRNNVKYNIIVTNKCYSTRNASSHKFSELELESLNHCNSNKFETIPKHVAIALDGNRRWLEAHGRDLDYTPFFDKNMVFAELCLKWGVPKGTSFMWGLGNFTKRSQEANNLFLGQFQKFIEDNLEYFKRKGIKVSAMGETTMLSKSIQDTIKQVEEETRNYKNLEFALPICYTGQRDIRNATRRICEKVKEGVIEPSQVTEDMIQNELSIPSSPTPDLFIRTGGEIRVGALLTWQISHTELYFTNTLAPEFGEDVFIDALLSFQQRNRKFGK